MLFWKNDRQPGNTQIWKRHGGCGWLYGLLVGLVFLGIGAVRGEFAVIWQKAVMICMECIGLG